MGTAVRLQWLTLAFLALGAGCADDSEQPTSTNSTGVQTTSSNNGAGGSGASSAGGEGQGGTPMTSSNGGSSNGGSTGDGGSGGGPSPGGLVRFVALGDQGKGNQGQNDIAAAVAAKCAADGCDFVQLLGDNLYESGASSPNDPQFQTLFEVPYAAIDLPFWVVLGNHDYGGNGTGNEFDKGQNEIDYTQLSTKWKLPAAYYHHVVDHTEFFALDMNMAMYNQADDQAADFPTWFAQSTATWKIAFGHHTYLSNGPHGNAGNYEGLPFVPIVNGQGVKDLLDDVVCGEADVYICGHDHDMQWMTGTCNGTELIVSGGGASTTDLEGNNPTYFESAALGFLYVRIEGNSFTGEFIDPAGNVLFTRTITK